MGEFKYMDLECAYQFQLYLYLESFTFLKFTYWIEICLQLCKHVTRYRYPARKLLS